MSVDIRLIAILDPAARGADALDAARAAVAGGVTALQLRMKDSAAGDLLVWAERLVGAVAVPVYVNDRVDVAWAAGAAGVHLGAADLPAARVRAHAPSPFRIGISVGNEREAAAARDAAADYWSIGAVYATPSKGDAGAPIGPAGLRALAATAPRATPIVAIGGVTAERVAAVCDAGASGVAVISAVFGSSEPERAARRLRDAVDAALRSSRGHPPDR